MNKLNESIKLPADKTVVLQADTAEHKRGLVITWKSDGGYDVAYWYDTPDNIVAAELKGDGESFGDIKNVWLGYHPKIDEGKLNEFQGKPIPMDTPNEFAYLTFKKYVYKNRGMFKKVKDDLVFSNKAWKKNNKIINIKENKRK